MALIGLQDVSIIFGGVTLLEHITLHIEEGERICLIGRNGAGKTTLMRLIAGELEPHDGILSRRPDSTAACLKQEVPAHLTGTIFDQVSAGLGQRGRMLAEYHLLSHRIATEPPQKARLEQLDKLQHALDRDDGWQVNRRVESIIDQMHLDADADFAGLSAGMKRRVLLAQALVAGPDVLLLDEPTNHLDIEAIIWLEEYLSRYEGAVIFVTHDRALLKRLATRIVELDRGRLSSYDCNYETYLKRRQEALEAEVAQQAQFDKKLAQEEVWIRQGIKARRTRNEGRVRDLKKLREERAQRKEAVGTVRLQTQDVQQSGRLVMEAKNVRFSYAPEQPLLADFSTTILRGDKIGIIGPNGVGKTTLLRVLLGKLPPQAGTLRQGVNLEIAYFDQLHAQLDDTKTIAENVADGSETVWVNGKPRHIVGYLQDFLFTPTQCRNPVTNLSGGERNRLLLARLFTRPSNVMVLDEPTNDLDMETLDLLEEFLMDYAGTVLLVSHDREFLNNVVTSTLVFEGNGAVKEYVGGYDDWLRQRPAAPEKPRPEKSAPRPAKAAAPDKPRRLTFKEKQELAGLPARIETLETEQRQLHEAMADPEFYKKPPAAITAMTARLDELQTQLHDTYARWETLEALSE